MWMKKIIGSLLTVLLVIVVLSAAALAVEQGPRSVNAVLLDIEQEQGVKTQQDIVASKVSGTLLEELGDSVMESMIGNSAQHDQIDARLGGDGSATLTRFHKQLGYDYLTGNRAGIMGLMMSAMRGGMMGGMMGYRGPGSNPVFYGWIWIVNAVLFLILLILLIILLTRTRRQRRQRQAKQ